jgi:pimeloyl-ACP methyl ester carboxylesterase/DNA-binding CsgD family transcriptional regulator
VTTPDTRYARNGNACIAYQVVGQGSLDLVFVPGFLSNLELNHEDARFSHLMRRLAAFARVIVVDKRGMGLSERIDPHDPPSVRERIEDVRVVMDAAGSVRAAFLGVAEGAALSVLFAAAFPDRVRALIVYAGFARFRTAVAADAELSDLVAGIEAGWGKGVTLSRFAATHVDDTRFKAWHGRVERLSATPTAAAALLRLDAAIDVRDALPKVQAPTLVVHRRGDAHVKLAAGKLVAGKIAGARLVELPGRDHLIFCGDVDAAVDRIEEFLTGSVPLPDSDRVLATLLVARLVAPEQAAARLGDRDWGDRVERLHQAVAEVLGRTGGQAVDLDADRLIARFDGPARAIRFALAMRQAADTPELRLAVGIHVGEVTVYRGTISGLSLHIAERIADRAKAGEIIVSGVVVDLVTGAGLRFAACGSERIEGLDGDLRLFAVAAEQHLEPVTRISDAPRLDVLTEREREVLAHVAGGLSNPAIAERLDLSEHTVKRHVANILLKLDLPTRAAAAALVGRRRAL